MCKPKDRSFLMLQLFRNGFVVRQNDAIWAHQTPIGVSLKSGKRAVSVKLSHKKCIIPAMLCVGASFLFAACQSANDPPKVNSESGKHGDRTVHNFPVPKSDSDSGVGDIPDIACESGTADADGSCVCGRQSLLPEEARFWQCALPQYDEKFIRQKSAKDADNDSEPFHDDNPQNTEHYARQFTCYRSTGCYARGQRYPLGASFRDDIAWCGSHRHPGGNYACTWDPDAQELMWTCQGNCQCGDTQVQIIDGRIMGGDLPLGYESFICDDEHGNATAGYRAVTGHEYCADLPMMKGQTCRNQTIFCGAHSESMPYDSGYICLNQKMVCVSRQCQCGTHVIPYRAECRNQQVFCNDTPYPSFPNDGDYICVSRGWMCINPSGCKSPTTSISTFAIYKNKQGWCGLAPQYPHAVDYICADDTWLCQNPKGCRFEKQSSDSPCFATHDGNACAYFQNMPNTTQYEISYIPEYNTLNTASDFNRAYSADTDGKFRYICKTPKPCKCDKDACGQGFSCVSGSCLCLDIAITHSEDYQCMTYGNAGILLRESIPCGDTPACRGACIDGKCIGAKGLLIHFTPIEDRRKPLETSTLCIDKSGCTLSNGQYLEFGTSLSPVRDQDLWLFYAKRYGWESCFDDALETDIFDIAENLRAIEQTPALYQCKVDPDADEHRIFICKSDMCSCNGDICHNGDICSPNNGCRMPDGSKRKAPMCGGFPLMYGQKCADGAVYCIDPSSASPVAPPQAFDPKAKKKTFQCKSLANGSRGWFAQSRDAKCGNRSYGTDYECRDEKPLCGGATYPGEDYVCQSPDTQKMNPKWTCTRAEGCECGELQTCPQSATCQDAQCACGGVHIVNPVGYQCKNDRWTCMRNEGCRSGQILCPYQSTFDGNSCICAGMRIPQNGICQSEQWICNDIAGCDCNGITITNGDYCTPTRFTIFDKDNIPDHYQKNTKRFPCGTRQCPPYTICYNGQCLFQSTHQLLQTPAEYKSVRGFPRCAQRSGCVCGDNTCKNGEFCVDNRCVKAPTYGMCNGKSVPIIKIHAQQHWRAISYADDTTITWKSLFERIPNLPDNVYSGASALQNSIKNAMKNGKGADFYQKYADPQDFDLPCLTMPDMRHIEDYAYWVATAQGIVWDTPEELLPVELSDFDEKSPFIYTNDTELRKKSANYIQFMDESSASQKPEQTLEAVGWVCAKSTCKCGKTICHKGDKCSIIDETHTCMTAMFSPKFDNNTLIQMTPYAPVEPNPVYDAIDLESENMADKAYHRYVLCDDEKGCACGTKKCLKDAACVDDRQCLNDCPKAAAHPTEHTNTRQCLIPYRDRHCSGADGVDDEGNCLFGQNKYLPNFYTFHHALGAQCQSSTCPCKDATCRQGQWCSREGTCIDSD